MDGAADTQKDFQKNFQKDYPRSGTKMKETGSKDRRKGRLPITENVHPIKAVLG